MTQQLLDGPEVGALLKQMGPEGMAQCVWMDILRKSMFEGDLLEDAIKASPNNAAIHYHLGMTYAKLSNSTNAVDHLKKAAALAPNTQTAKDADKELSLLS